VESLELAEVGEREVDGGAGRDRAVLDRRLDRVRATEARAVLEAK
jgi:hypothetical protein